MRAAINQQLVETGEKERCESTCRGNRNLTPPRAHAGFIIWLWLYSELRRSSACEHYQTCHCWFVGSWLSLSRKLHGTSGLDYQQRRAPRRVWPGH